MHALTQMLVQQDANQPWILLPSTPPVMISIKGAHKGPPLQGAPVNNPPSLLFGVEDSAGKCSILTDSVKVQQYISTEVFTLDRVFNSKPEANRWQHERTVGEEGSRTSRKKSASRMMDDSNSSSEPDDSDDSSSDDSDSSEEPRKKKKKKSSSTS